MNEVVAGFGPVKFDLDYPLWDYGSLQAETVATLESIGFGFTEN